MILGQLALCEECRDGSCDACKRYKRRKKAHTMGRRDYTQMKGWTLLSGGAWWTGEDAMWAKKTKAGWFVIKTCDLREYDSTCEDFQKEPFEAQLRLVELERIPEEERDAALRACGWEWKREGDDIVLVNGQGDSMRAGPRLTLAAVQMCVEYGLGAPLEEFTSNRYLIPRAKCRRAADAYAGAGGDAELEARLSRPVNAIGSTARECGVGNVTAALHRGPVTPEKELMRKIGGWTVLKQSDMLKCTFAIMLPSHYRDDGTCKCDSAAERERMRKEWEYTEKDLARLPPVSKP